MKTNKILLALLISLFITCGTIILATAQPPADQSGSLQSGYYVTNNYHGIDTQLNAPVQVTAYTTDFTVSQVTFIWRNAAGKEKWTDVVTVYTDTTFNGYNVRKFVAPTHAPDSIGDWGVQAVFQGPDGREVANLEDVLAIRATSFNVIPEIPLIGTAGATLAMFAGLTYKLKRKNKP